jgi:DNA processing protein
VAEELGRGLSTAGVTVVSGMALGIDGAAHRGALRASEPRTVAVLGGGADVVYPRVHRGLYDQIRATGVIIAEAPPGRRPFRWSFPARNRIMAGLATMTIVVEAADPSGSLITSTFATQLGRTVAAVPGRVTSAGAAGSNKLLRDGATFIRHAGDVLDELFGAGSAELLAQAREPVLGEREQRVLEAVEQGLGSGAIAAATELDPGQVRAALGALEMAGAIRRTGIGSYERRAARHP